MKRARIAGVGALAVVLCSACEAPTDPLPRNARRLTPPPAYGLWWQMTMSCSGLSGDLERVQWYIQPGVRSLEIPGEPDTNLGGYWISSGNRILLTEAAVDDGELVRHEMLHALLRGRGQHPKEFFRRRCGGFVSCSGACASDGGPDPQPPAGAAVIDVRELTVTTELVPPNFAGVNTENAFAIIVSARNPRPAAIWVRLRKIPESDASETFGTTGLRYSWYDFVYGDSIAFAANETKRMAFDHKGSELFFRPGDVRGFFNVDTAPPLQFSARP